MRLPALIITTTVVLSPALGAQPARDTVRTLVEAGSEVARIGSARGTDIWPGFRPDTIPVSFVLPTRGNLLVGWRGALPPGYVPVAGMPGIAWHDDSALSAASTAVSVQGRNVAQVVVGHLDPVMLSATAVHEAFHVFEAASRRPGVKFGQGENSMLISSYPVFDEGNELAFAIEGTLLAEALDTKSSSSARELAQEFVAVRRERHRLLPVEYAEFDQRSELNEGLAEYALVRALRATADDGPAAWRQAAKRALADRIPLLWTLTRSENLSLRFRFYQTGPVEALLLDRLAGPGWKARMIETNSTLQDMLADASGVDAVAIRARRVAMERAAAVGSPAKVAAQISALKRSRQVQADSILASPGVRLELRADSLPGTSFNMCGYDPQNLLQVTASVRIHSRWWRPCAGGPTNAEFNVPSVQDDDRGVITAIIGALADITLTSNGRPVALADGETLRDVRAFKLMAPRASVEAVRADVSRHGETIEIKPKRP